MLVSSIKNYQEILKFFPQLDIVFDFIKNKVSYDMKDTRIELANGIYAVIQTCQPKPKKEQVLEKHKKYVDLQFVISGKEKIGWKYFDDNFKVLKEYNSGNDIAFYSDIPDTFINLNEGEFAIFFPEDTHAPLCYNDTVKKCIVKIPIEYLNNNL